MGRLFLCVPFEPSDLFIHSNNKLMMVSLTFSALHFMDTLRTLEQSLLMSRRLS